MVLLLATILASAPVAPSTSGLRARLDVGGMMAASWYVPASRAHMEAALRTVRGSLFHNELLDVRELIWGAPVLGPWLLAGQASLADDDRVLLFATGMLQAVGLSVSAIRLVTEESEAPSSAPTLSVSPIAGGRLGLSLKLTGF